MKDTVLDGFTIRRSIRSYTGEPVNREKLAVALKAAMAAPSANNGKPWSFVVVTKRERIRAVCTAHPYAAFGANAGAVVIPFGTPTRPFFDQDMGAATENLLLALAQQGLGATWCGLDDELQSVIRPLIGLPADARAFAVIPVGVPAEKKEPRTQYEEARVHWERFSG